jgi:putative membrane protein
MSETSERSEDVLAADLDWRRLDPRMLLVHPVNEVIRFLPALVAVFFVGHASSDNLWWHVGAVTIPIVIGVVRYFTTRFRITPERLELHRGLISRNVLSARLDKVRTVELTSSPIHRMLGLAKVQIGTGSAAKDGDEKFVLDSLGISEARALRHALLHRRTALAGGATTADDDVLLHLDPRWVRFAPLTTGGLLIALGALAAGNQLAGPLLNRLSHRVDLHQPQHPALTIATGVIVLIAAISTLSVIGYVLTNWGFTLTRDAGARSLHIRKGLLTTKETSLELARVRGVEVHEPLGLRSARGARLVAIVTGLTKHEAGSTALVPPAPRGVVRRTAAAVLDTEEPLTLGLDGHGARCTRRRYVRALAGAGLVDLAAALALLGWDCPPGWYAVLAVPPFAGLFLARDRARRLGHGLTDHYLVTRTHSLRGRRTVLEREGIIGWNLAQTWFQRRAGLVTLVATTAAGRQGYVLIDIPEETATALAAAAVPGLLDEFLSAPTPRPPA